MEEILKGNVFGDPGLIQQGPESCVCSHVRSCGCVCVDVRACACFLRRICVLSPSPTRPAQPGPHSSQRRHLVNLPAPPSSPSCRTDLRSDVWVTGNRGCFTGCGRCPHGNQSGGLADVCGRWGRPLSGVTSPSRGLRQDAVGPFLILRGSNWVCKIALGGLTKRQLRYRFKK